LSSTHLKINPFSTFLLFFVVVVAVRLSLRGNTKCFCGNPLPLVVNVVSFNVVTANPIGCGSLWKNQSVYRFVFAVVVLVVIAKKHEVFLWQSTAVSR
jgi:uncharacterized membrane protein